MSSQRRQQIEQLYHSARERGEHVLSGADPEIRVEVEKLLAEDTATGLNLLDQPAAVPIADLAPTKTEVGSSLGPYKIEGLLARGGMGQVFRGTDTRLGRPVAIKISNEQFIARFQQEARAIAALNHPHICTLYDVGPDYLVMELVEGETLAERLKRGRLSLEQTMRFGAQIAEALAAAHAKGIVHRDLKPGNVMLTKTGVKVLDFGLARTGVEPGLTVHGAVMGTPAYMAPEQLEGKKADARTDIYALGLMLLEMATGKRSEKRDSVGPPLDRVITRCLEEDPDERWQSARDLKWELESSRGRSRRSTGALAERAARRRSWINRAPAGRARRRALPPTEPATPADAREHPASGELARAVARGFTRWPGHRHGSGPAGKAADLGADTRLSRTVRAAGHRRRGGSVLVSGQPLYRILRRCPAQEGRSLGRARTNALRRALRNRRNLESKWRYSDRRAERD